jgi:hypothetical protein
MPDLADLFPGYDSKWIDTRSGRVFARVGGNGPPLLLLHGFSSTHVMWHQVAPQLADRFTLIIADLPSYGWSDIPESDGDHTPYTKRAMAQTMVEAMEALGHVHFALAGHEVRFSEQSVSIGVTNDLAFGSRLNRAKRADARLPRVCLQLLGPFRYPRKSDS